MDAGEWNSTYPVGTKVVVTLHNGKRLVTRTCSDAARWGGMDHVAVEAIQPGYVLLSWVKAFHPTPSAPLPRSSRAFDAAGG